MNEIEKLWKEYEEARYEYEVAEVEFQRYGGIWNLSASNQAWNYMQKLLKKINELEEEK